MRVPIDSPLPAGQVRQEFGDVATRYAMTWGLHTTAERLKVLVLVSRQGHCLNDLLYRWRSGLLPADIVGVVSDHTDLEPLAAGSGVGFHHLPFTPSCRDEQETELLRLCDELGVDLVVLARYMQVLSPTVCEAMPG